MKRTLRMGAGQGQAWMRDETTRRKSRPERSRCTTTEAALRSSPLRLHTAVGALGGADQRRSRHAGQGSLLLQQGMDWGLPMLLTSHNCAHPQPRRETGSTSWELRAPGTGSTREGKPQHTREPNTTRERAATHASAGVRTQLLRGCGVRPK